MKKILLTLSVLGIAFTHAQQGINTEKAGATLDIKASKTDGTTKEGLLIPRMDKTAVSKIAQPEISTLIFVNEVTNYTKGADNDADARVAKVDEVGFYHFDGKEWIKHLDEWVYDAEAKRINLRRSGETGANAKFKNKIFYNAETGQFINTYADEVRQRVVSSGVFSVKNNEDINNISKANNINIVSSKNMESVLSDINVQAKSVNYHRLDVDPTEETPYMMVNTNELNIESDNAKNYTYAYADAVSTNLRGTGKVEFALGQWGQVNVRNQQSVDTATGVAGVANMGTTGNVNYAYGVRGNIAAGILPRSKSEVITAAAGRFDFTGRNNVLFKNNIGISVYSTNLSTNTGQGDVMAGIHNTVLNQGKTQYANMYGIYTGASVYENSVRPTNLYGLYIDNIKDGQTLNYAIYTNGGKVHLGDELEVKSTIKIANSTNDTCDGTKAGTIRFVNDKFQGCTSTGWKDLHQ